MRGGSKPHDLTGQRFGRLVAVEMTGERRYGQVVWRCVCDCGGETTAASGKLTTGIKKACGCQWVKHPERSDEYRLTGVWKQMLNRCRNPKNKDFRYYGSKGINVCEGWLKRETFIEWALQSGYKRGLSIDRLDPHGDYAPDNCHWMGHVENSKKQSHDMKRGRKPHEETDQPVPGPVSKTA